MDTIGLEETMVASKIGPHQHIILAFLSWYHEMTDDESVGRAVGVSLRFLNSFIPLVFGDRPSRSSLSRSRKALEEIGYIDSYTLGALGMVWEKRRTTWQTNPLVRMQKKSAKLDLEQRTQVKLTIALLGVLDYRKPNSVVVQNTGAVDAHNVHVKVWSGENPPEEIRDETT